MEKGLSLSRNMVATPVTSTRALPSVDRVYGYQKYDTPEEMAAALKQLFSRQLFPLISKGLSGAVYTQLSDVEEEVNGLVTYDRRIVKLPVGHPFAAPSSFAAPYSHGNKPE